MHPVMFRGYYRTDLRIIKIYISCHIPPFRDRRTAVNSAPFVQLEFALINVLIKASSRDWDWLQYPDNE